MKLRVFIILLALLALLLVTSVILGANRGGSRDRDSSQNFDEDEVKRFSKNLEWGRGAQLEPKDITSVDNPSCLDVNEFKNAFSNRTFDSSGSCTITISPVSYFLGKVTLRSVRSFSLCLEEGKAEVTLSQETLQGPKSLEKDITLCSEEDLVSFQVFEKGGDLTLVCKPDLLCSWKLN